jgi:hypothetical protein
LGDSPIKNITDDTSWFRDTPHYWAEAWLPLAYAVACVEVVCESSEKARILYNRIIEAWKGAEIKVISDKIYSVIPESEKGKIKNALLHPETELLPDPNRPFKELEKLFTSMEVDGEVFIVEETAKLERLVSEFIIVGFNRESDIESGRCRVLPSENALWLSWAIAMRTILASYKNAFERVRDFYKVRKYKGKVINFQKVLKEQPMSRWHRRMVASSKAVNLKLKNDRTIVKAARRWYQCRVVYQSINKFCDDQSKKGIILDPKNVDKQIRPCDEALCYIRRLPRKRK